MHSKLAQDNSDKQTNKQTYLFTSLNQQLTSPGCTNNNDTTIT